MSEPINCLLREGLVRRSGILVAIICLAVGARSARAERYMIIGDSLSREYQFEFTEFDEARNWVEILSAIRPDDFDFGKLRTVDLSFIDSSWDINSHAYNWALPTFSADQYNGLLNGSGLTDLLFQQLINPAYDDTERAVIFIGGNDLDRIYNEIYQGRDENNTGVKAIYSDIEDILLEVENQNSDLGIVLVNVPHVGATPEVKSAHPTDPVMTQRVSDAIELLNRQLAKLAVEHDAAFADVYTLTKGLIDPAPLCIGGVPFINEGSDDGDPSYVWLGGNLAANFHPNTNGQALVARAIVDAINEHFSENIAPLTDAEILESVLNVSPSMPFDTWAAGFGLPEGQSGTGDDPDSDGVDNVIEFALGMHPLEADSQRLPSPVAESIDGASMLTMRYQPRAEDCPFVKIIPQSSIDLDEWETIAPTALTTSSDGTVTVRLPLSGTVYIRLLVTIGG
ncbi:MAG: hypothetical protein KDN22_21490 [Verrucomicrobiae bacterium]|nr:hypothetical protein [Verrucomicrobiae bacterium]